MDSVRTIPGSEMCGDIIYTIAIAGAVWALVIERIPQEFGV